MQFGHLAITAVCHFLVGKNPSKKFFAMFLLHGSNSLAFDNVGSYTDNRPCAQTMIGLFVCHLLNAPDP
jgi:hypothetical protein